MSLRTKIFLAIALTMLAVITLVALQLVFHTLSQYKRHKESFDASMKQIVENWVSTALPETLTQAELLERLDQYEQKFFVPAAAQTPTDARALGLFEQIVLIDRYRQVARVVGDNRDVPAKLYEPPELFEALKTGTTQTVGRTVYRPFTRPVEFESRNDGQTQTETLWVLQLRLRLELPEPVTVGDLVGPVVLFMLVGTGSLIFFVLVLLSRLVFKPIERLSSVSHSIALGDYSKRLPTPTSADEIGTLVRAFDSMMREVQHHRQNLKQEIEEAVRRQRKAEQGLIIAQRLAATGTLAAGIAHEINNPLMGMQNAVRRLQRKLDDQLDTKSKDYLDLITEGLQRIQDIVRQVLDVSRRRVNPKPFEMAEPVHQAVAFVAHKAKRYDVKIVVEPTRGPMPLCFGDRGEINQVLTNLLINGIDAVRDAREQDTQAKPEAPPRDGLVTVRWESVEEGVRTSVTDTGIGMTPEQASRAFDAFYTTKQDGTGLGLAIIHNIIDSHGGTIEIDSAPGLGTTVTFTIPKSLE